MSESVPDALAAVFERFDAGEAVELFEVDASALGGGVFRFAPAPVDGAPPRFGGHVYAVIPHRSEGWAWTAGGPPPQPTVTFQFAREDGDFSTAAGVLLGLLSTLDDMLGARVTRLRTLREHLDDGDDPDPAAHLPPEIYTVERKTAQSQDGVTFQLASGLDQEDVMLPRRQALGRCQLRYRRWDAAAGAFDYTGATCPYTGPQTFDLSGAPSSDAGDRCAKGLDDCRARFGQAATLPYGGFPGVGRVRL